MRRTPLPFLALLAATALSGCSGLITDTSPEPGAPATPTQQYPLKAKAAADQLRLAAHANGLSPAQREALADLAVRWRNGGSGAIVVQTPSQGADVDAAYRTSMAAMGYLASLGVPAERLRRVGYDPGQERPAPVIVGFDA